MELDRELVVSVPKGSKAVFAALIFIEDCRDKPTAGEDIPDLETGDCPRKGDCPSPSSLWVDIRFAFDLNLTLITGSKNMPGESGVISPEPILSLPSSLVGFRSGLRQIDLLLSSCSLSDNPSKFPASPSSIPVVESSIFPYCLAPSSPRNAHIDGIFCVHFVFKAI
jgi:hypothetical protein